MCFRLPDNVEHHRTIGIDLFDKVGGAFCIVVVQYNCPNLLNPRRQPLVINQLYACVCVSSECSDSHAEGGAVAEAGSPAAEA